MLHADVKAETVLVSEDGRARLTDFDVSVDSERRTTIAFTPAVVAPEMLKTGATVATDMYSFGRMLEALVPAGAGEAGDVDSSDLVELLTSDRPTRRPTAEAGLAHAFFRPVFHWQQSAKLRACIVCCDDIAPNAGLDCGDASHWSGP